MRSIRHYLLEANIPKERWKFWYNVGSGKIIWLGGEDHHAHIIYYQPTVFGLTHEQVTHLADLPAMQDTEVDSYGNGDEGGRIIYLPELFWDVMQHGWVRGGIEGDYDDHDSDIMHPYGLYLEGKSLIDLSRAARYVAEEVVGDPDFPNDDEDWVVETLRLEVRTDKSHDGQQKFVLHDKRAEYFMKTGRIPSATMR
jgi:hypothetical protein